MSYGAGGSGAGLPTETGQNVVGREIILVSGNTLDSVASSDIGVFVPVLTNSNAFYPAPVYNTGVWTLGAGDVSMDLAHAQPRSVKIVASGVFKSDSTANNGHIAMRLVDTSAVLTGTTKRYSAGTTAGASTIEVGFTIIGYTTVTTGQTVHLEVAKDFSGTVVLDSVLMSTTPLL